MNSLTAINTGIQISGRYRPYKAKSKCGLFGSFKLHISKPAKVTSNVGWYASLGFERGLVPVTYAYANSEEILSPQLYQTSSRLSSVVLKRDQ